MFLLLGKSLKHYCKMKQQRINRFLRYAEFITWGIVLLHAGYLWLFYMQYQLAMEEIMKESSLYAYVLLSGMVYLWLAYFLRMYRKKENMYCMMVLHLSLLSCSFLCMRNIFLGGFLWYIIYCYIRCYRKEIKNQWCRINKKTICLSISKDILCVICSAFCLFVSLRL